MDTDTTDLLEQQLRSEVGNLRRALKATISDCEGALTALEEGRRPGFSTDGSILDHNAMKVEHAAAKVHALLNYAGSPILSSDAANKALTDRFFG